MSLEEKQARNAAYEIFLSLPDPNSPIGVASEPPVIHCNVTVSEGGDGVANNNGNVSSGNTAKKIDACISQQQAARVATIGTGTRFGR